MWLGHWHQPYRSPFTRVAAAPYPNATTPHAPYSGAQLLADTRALITRFKPTRIFTTHPNDTHPDHWACWAFALAALESLRADENNAWARQCGLRAFMVHRGVWPAPHGYNPQARLSPPADLLHGGAARTWTSWNLDEAARTAKKTALTQHDSQMAFTPHYLRGFLRRNELFEIIEAANEHTAFELGVVAPRGISLVALNNEFATLRVHLRLAAAPRGNCRLHLRAFSAQDARAWNVDLHGRESKAHIKDEAFVARAHEDGGTSHNWRARRSEAGGGKRHARGGTTFDLDVPLQALGSEQDVSLLVSGVSRLGKAVLEQTEIGAIRLREFQNRPLLVARSDPRYSVREKLRAARQDARRAKS
jgi:LmbE family N-acetylglucosaminyl deacetylase